MDRGDLRERLPESLDDVEVEDSLEALGLAAGAFLVLVGLGTIAGAPWTYKASLPVAVIQVVGALAAIGVGAGLAWLVRT